MSMILPLTSYEEIKEKSVYGRYLSHEMVAKYLESIKQEFEIKEVGLSVRQKKIHTITLGTGKTKILMWSQMHGNESTTTKAVFDFINFLRTDAESSRQILENCTIKIIPMLNPDGADAYTRVNANEVDLNRDAQNRTQPESIVLRKVYEGFSPDFCFNLHDQRTIFNVGTTPKPATVSFLAPAYNEERSISPSRAISMKLIVAMNDTLQKLIPDQVGRYDDSFNANCVGDTFQMMNTPTILFESGHYPNDYEREETRWYIFQALLKGVAVISENKVNQFDLESYQQIPENQKLFLDLLLKNVQSLTGKKNTPNSCAFHFKETLIDGKIEFVPELQEEIDLRKFYFHATYDCAVTSDLQALKSQIYYPDISSSF
ncbi:M14 family metallopeptidase [Euzebyella saccharophila]|uniref:M14 metallopeptidase family protein n=1 Tax=Euzebyella saccharophila TaxID=679664 RepID=A0ABV8JPR3_9FLAO|nr:M14 metallopeptidase family protein [Euzebyella saccharophila]